MYSSSKLVTLGLLSLRMPLAKELFWGKVAQGLVRSDGVVDALPGLELLVQGGHLQGELHDFIELLRVGALARSTAPLSLGERGGRVKSRMPRCWHACSKPPWNSEPPSTWMALTGKGIRTCKASRKPAAVVAVARVWDLHHVPAGDHVPGSEMLEHNAWDRSHVQDVQLDQVPRLLYRVTLGLAHSVGTPPQTLPGGDTIAGRLL